MFAPREGLGPCAAASQVLFVSDAIRKAQPGSKLHGRAPIVDPSDEIIEVLLAAVRWDMPHHRVGNGCGVGQTPCPIRRAA
jgi:hypothetical protein